jgi:imidazolonepropionase-like amidohydrolase
MKRTVISLFVCLAVAFIAVAEEEILTGSPEGAPRVVLIRNGTILTMAGPPIERGSILIEDGVIKEIGKNIAAPDGAKVIDATGKYVLPGLVIPYSYYGLTGYRGDDSQEYSNAVTPEMRVTDAIYPTPPQCEEVRHAGITALVVAPDNRNIVGGQGALVRPYGLSVEVMTVRAPAVMVFALGEPPKTTHSGIMTRMGSAAQLRSALQSTVERKEALEEYAKKKEKYEKEKSAFGEKKTEYEAKLKEWAAKPEAERGEKPAEPKEPTEPKAPKIDYKWDPMVEVLNGKLTAVIYAQRADDILTALRIGEEYGIKFVIYGGVEAYKVADVLADKQVHVIFGPMRAPMGGMESYEHRTTTPGVLASRGITVALRGDESGMYRLGGLREIMLDVALAVRDGMNPDEALKMVTINPARIYGFDDRKGSLEVGKDADVIIYDRHPLGTTSFCVGVISLSKDGPCYIWTSSKKEILESYSTVNYQ